MELLSLILHHATSVPVFLAFLLAVAFYIYYTREYRTSVLFIVPILATMIIVYFLKEVFAVPRPDEALVNVTTYSFPSAHAALSMSFAIMMLYVFTEKYSKQMYQYAHVGAWLFFVPVIGYSRIELGVHRPEEVIAGYITGVVVTLIVVALIVKVWPDTRKYKWQRS